MTNEERKALIAQGWTPPVAVDPDLIKARKIAANVQKTVGLHDGHIQDTLDGENDDILTVRAAIAAIKRGRALAAEAKPGMVWVKHDGSKYCPAPLGVWVTTRVNGGGYVYYSTQMATDSNWRWVTHYAIIPPPAEDK